MKKKQTDDMDAPSSTKAWIGDRHTYNTTKTDYNLTLSFLSSFRSWRRFHLGIMWYSHWY